MGPAKFGYVYDERMLEHECKYDKTMAECPERMFLIHRRLQEDKLLDNALKIEAREATEEELLRNHPQELINEIKQLESGTEEDCERFCKDKEIIWTCTKSNQAARLAAGSSIDLVKAVVEGKAHNGFAIVRPPGHHSYGKLPQGYCIFNNVAIAAKHAVEALGVERVAVIDFDYHAGNGTFMSLKNDKRFHFTSFHAYHHGAFWPYNADYYYDTGNPNLLMVPLNGSMNSEGDYLSVFHHVLLPMLRQFKPNLIILSSGFDAGYYDVMMEHGQGVKAHGYGHMARLLNNLCPGKVVAVLEGGYYSYNYVECASMLVRGLKEMPLPRIEYPERISAPLLETTWNLLIHHSAWYPEIGEKVQDLMKQQNALNLDGFTPNVKTFMGDKLRKLYDSVISAKIVKTREWFPPMTMEQKKLCNKKIDEYKMKYEFTTEHVMPSNEFMLKQCVWNNQTRTEAFIESAPFVTLLVKEFNEFVEGKRNSLMICDKLLYNEQVEQGKLKYIGPIENKFDEGSDNDD